MPQPNNGFVASIHAFDPLLNVRWGDYIGRWVIERTSFLTETERWYLVRRIERFRVRFVNTPVDHPSRKKFEEEYNEIREEFRSMQSGRRVVLMPKELNQLAFNLLGMMDIQRWGGYSRMADELEAQESRREADAERILTNERKALHAHVYDVLDFLWRKRSSELINGAHLHKSLKQIVGTSEL